MGSDGTPEASSVTSAAHQAFEALFAETLLRLESRVARTAMWAGGIAFVVSIVGILWGSFLPHAIPLGRLSLLPPPSAT